MKHLFRFFPYMLILLAGCWIAPIASGQPPKIIPPLPEAASFFKSTEIPVSAYAGTPNIGVDLYTIQTKELQIPIRMTYNARGIQVAEVASRVGLGWALQYGGMISRQIRGLADDGGHGILWYSNYNQLFTNATKRGSYQDGIINNEIDEQPDQFYFDVNGQNGKFIFDHNDQSIIQQQFSDMKIVPVFDNTLGIVAWKVTDKMGNRFYYGKSKNGSRTYNETDPPPHSFMFSSAGGMTDLNTSGDGNISTWHLVEIETYLNETIEFYYELENGVQYLRSYDKVYKPATGGMAELQSFFSKNISNQYQVSEIRFPGGKVLFGNDATDRTDLPGAYALRTVSVKNSSDEIIKSFTLRHHYDVSTNDANQLAYLKLVYPAGDYRLVLDKVVEKNAGGDSLPAYQFFYNSTKLPNRFSNSQDAWGYYNGADNGEYLTFLTYSKLMNRRVDSSRAGASILNKIIYPTGGSVELTYEQNRVVPLGFISDLSTYETDAVDSMTMMESMGRDSIFLVSGAYQKDFTVGKNIVSGSQGRFSLLLPAFTEDDHDVTVSIERTDSAYSYTLYPSSLDQYINLPPGPYRLKVQPNPGVTHAFMASISWPIILAPSADQVEGTVWSGAGKRIKKIVHKNADQTALTKSYEYLKTGGGSSGKMFGLPNFRYINQYAYQSPATGVIYFFAVLDQWGSGAGSPLANVQGNSLGYERVTEYLGDSATNTGKTVYEFTTDIDGSFYYKFPYHLPIDNEWLRGKPTSTKMYKNTGDSYELVKSIENTYSYAGFESMPAKFDDIFFQTAGDPDTVYRYRKDSRSALIPYLIFKDDDFNPFTNPVDFKVYYQTAGSFDLASTTVTNYAGTSSSAQYTWFDYNYDRHYQQTAQRTKNSKGDSVVSTQVYLPDIDIGSRTTAQQKLVDGNRIATPVSVTNTVKSTGGTVLAQKNARTLFKDWGSDLVLPEYMQSNQNGGSYNTDVTFTAYDGFGAPLQFKPRSGVSEVYFYGYKSQYPVAMITGRTYDDLVTVSGVDLSVLNNPSSDGALRTELAKLRTVSGAFVTSYTYNPLVGITSKTDVNGVTTYYEYDAFKRLKLIRDKDNHIIQQFEYSYYQ